MGYMVKGNYNITGNFINLLINTYKILQNTYKNLYVTVSPCLLENLTKVVFLVNHSIVEVFSRFRNQPKSPECHFFRPRKPRKKTAKNYHKTSQNDVNNVESRRADAPLLGD